MTENLLGRLKTGLNKTRQTLATPVSQLLSKKQKLNEEELSELEDLLISSDMGYHLADEVINKIRNHDKSYSSEENHIQTLKSILVDKISDSREPAEVAKIKPRVIMFVGVNGSGKTTTVGKMADYLRAQGSSVILAAADTFRDAAIEQLLIWGERSGFRVVRHQQGSDPSAVVFDAIKSALASNVDYVLIDTAGRLHTKHNLMKELEKMQRIAAREVPGAPHEIYLVLDANTGQNGIIQAEKFLNSVNVSSIIVSKLDGTARAGFIFAIKEKTGLPVEYIGIGEKLNDLIPFEPEYFVDALLSE